VIRFQGPRANGMPELHALTPALSNLQDAGYHVAMVTDGRMSGASGKVPAAIHVSPEILAGGPLGLVRDGDIIRVDATQGTLEALVPADVWAARKMATADLSKSHIGMGRELFACSANPSARPRRAPPTSRCRRRSTPPFPCMKAPTAARSCPVPTKTSCSANPNKPSERNDE
jgi:dihydroxyacid dehydratase/phosphogluconate dehydratase